MDRWKIISLGVGEFEDMRKDVTMDYPADFQMFVPPKFPDLDEDFDLRSFLLDDNRDNEISCTNENLQNGTVHRAGTSDPDREVFSQTSTISDGEYNLILLILSNTSLNS